MLKDVRILDQYLQVDTVHDYYGEIFWDKITKNQWEPDTLGFIRTYCNPETHFMDIGAANGAMTLAAAACGSTTIAYEPDPVIFQVLKRNVALNPGLANLIEISPSAVSDMTGNLVFDKESNPEILTNILFGERVFESTEIEVKSIVNEINRIALSGKKILIKIDIEGAEYKIFRNLEVLEALKRHNSIVLIAIHPGFNRTYQKSKVHKKLSEKLWQHENNRENKEFFSNVSSRAEIRRTNLNIVKTAKQFSALSDAGYHEFILNFEDGFFL